MKNGLGEEIKPAEGLIEHTLCIITYYFYSNFNKSFFFIRINSILKKESGSEDC